ncbi:hypothetical protein ABTK01_20715, partial [Acinetobacter baumannii]
IDAKTSDGEYRECGRQPEYARFSDHRPQGVVVASGSAGRLSRHREQADGKGKAGCRRTMNDEWQTPVFGCGEWSGKEQTGA